jgi:hypothetical protein
MQYTLKTIEPTQIDRQVERLMAADKVYGLALAPGA